jgi:DNA-binding TFAR19-related protein (PDSD5 family)
MQIINGKLITEDPDNAAALQYKLEQIVSKSEQLERGLETQSKQIEELKMTIILLENNLNSRDLERFKQIQLSHDSLTNQISQKLFKISVATVLGFLSIWGLVLVNNHLEKTQKSAHAYLINTSEIIANS